MNITLKTIENSPFLISKHLERNYLAFTQLVYSKKQMQDEDLINEEVQKMILKESSVKKKLNLMCQAPKKILIHFYKNNEDISLGDMIKEFALKSVIICGECKELYLNHSTCYYHLNGYIEIRLKCDNHYKNDMDAI